MHINLIDKITEYKELTVKLAPVLNRTLQLRDKCRARFEQPEPLTKEEYSEHHQLTHEVRELKFKGQDIALDIAAYLCNSNTKVYEQDGKIIIEREV